MKKRFVNKDQQARYELYLSIFNDPVKRAEIASNPRGGSSRRTFWDGFHLIAHYKPARNAINYPIYCAGEQCRKTHPELANRY